MKAELLDILACPICKASPLKWKKSSKAESLICSVCGRIYEVIDKIPYMFSDELGSNLYPEDNGWSDWEEKLKKFIEWRRMMWDGRPFADKANANAMKLNEKFIDFTSLRNSSKKILDIGCGGGSIRTMLGSCIYYGIDPLLIENHRYDFFIVRGVGEYLPFIDKAFDAVILTQVLDHCNSLDRLITEAARVVNNNGSINVQQGLNRARGFTARVYQKLIEIYFKIKGVTHLDTKMRYFDKKELLSLFKEKFEVVRFLENSKTQIFIKASGWKKHRK